VGPKIDELTSYLVKHGLLFDARVVAEYRRDRLRRAVSRRNIAQDANDFLAGKLFAPVVADGQAVVLEFLQLTDGWAPILTWQPAGEVRVRSEPLEAPDFDVVELRDRIVNRLQGWVRGRPGDPFDVAHWTEFCAWLRTSIDEALFEPSHLVVIEAEGLEGIPFHVAVAPEWTCSYASSWMSLHAAISVPRARPEQLGFAMVPAYADDITVSAAMHAAGRSLKGLADRVRLRYEESIGAACDKDALSALLAASDVAFVASHGFHFEDGGEVAWVLAHRGGLPGKSGALVQVGDGAVNHLSWRDIERLKSTPQIVFSAACSSGRAIVVGLGERIGLYQSLSSRGTQTLVAPAWDVEADLVMPIAVRALELHLERPMTLANAVREACSAANKDLPAWCAWPLTIEGAWQ
jgi:CHAT domain